MSQLTIQLIVSALIVLAVLWFMWRLPRSGDKYFSWAPPLAFISAWMGLLGLVLSVVVRWLRYPDTWVALLFLMIDPIAIGTGTLVLWVYRGHDSAVQTIAMQHIQARVGIALGILAVAAGVHLCDDPQNHHDSDRNPRNLNAEAGSLQ